MPGANHNLYNCGAELNHENTKLFEKLSFFIMNETEPP
jgi:hypothetical protein